MIQVSTILLVCVFIALWRRSCDDETAECNYIEISESERITVFFRLALASLVGWAAANLREKDPFG